MCDADVYNGVDIFVITLAWSSRKRYSFIQNQQDCHLNGALNRDKDVPSN